MTAPIMVLFGLEDKKLAAVESALNRLNILAAAAEIVAPVLSEPDGFLTSATETL